ncbi:chaperone protein [Bacillus phage vB_BanS-Thrax5]|nr:chaperone protein [Bacillus phage vB_BanS-Thrax5]
MSKENKEKCWNCHGSGKVSQVRVIGTVVTTIRVPCSHCDGTGYRN